MGAPLARQKKFRGRKARAELIGTFEQKGASETMRVFNIRKPKTLKRLLNDIGYSLNERASPLAGMNGGEKEMFIRQHRDTIMDCIEIFGKDTVMQMFNLREETMERIAEWQPKTEYKKTTNSEAAVLKADTALDAIKKLEHEIELLKIKTTETAELREEVRNLSELFSHFTESTANQVSKALLIPLLQNIIKFDGQLPENIDSLSFEALLPPDIKRKLNRKNIKEAQKRNGDKYKENPLLETIELISSKLVAAKDD